MTERRFSPGDEVVVLDELVTSAIHTLDKRGYTSKLHIEPLPYFAKIESEYTWADAQKEINNSPNPCSEIAMSPPASWFVKEPGGTRRVIRETRLIPLAEWDFTQSLRGIN